MRFTGGMPTHGSTGVRGGPGHRADEPDRRAWVAPLIGTLAMFPMTLFLLALVTMSPTACESCDAREAVRFADSLEVAVIVAMAVGAVAWVLVLTAWVMPPLRRLRARRVLLVVAAPLVAAGGYPLFDAVLAWP